MPPLVAVKHFFRGSRETKRHWDAQGLRPFARPLAVPSRSFFAVWVFLVKVRSRSGTAMPALSSNGVADSGVMCLVSGVTCLVSGVMLGLAVL